MANIISLSAQNYANTSSSKLVQVGVASIVDVVPYINLTFPNTNAVVFTNSQNLAFSQIYTAEAPSTIKALANAPLA